MSVTFTPVDKAGNYWGVGRANDVRFTVKGTRPLLGAMDNLDGSYTQVVEFKTDTRPVAYVSVGSAESGPIPLQRSPTGGPKSAASAAGRADTSPVAPR